MKKRLYLILTLSLLVSCLTKNSNVDNRVDRSRSERPTEKIIQEDYTLAMEAYRRGDYEHASALFQSIMDQNELEDLTSNTLYNAACIFSLVKENNIAIEILDHLASDRFYSSYDHLLSDTDLNNLHSEPLWNKIAQRVAENRKVESERFHQKIKTELFKAKDILHADNGKLWGEKIWSDDILVLDHDNTIYTTKPLQNSKTNDSIIYYKKIPENTLGFSNAAQKFDGKEYAVILSNYLDDNSSTIIHELFHVLQNSKIALNGNPIEYLDNYDAREWLRLEYQALRNALNAIILKKATSEIETYVSDAVLFRKLRQTKYKEYQKEEIEIETSEGLANYTGFLLSTYPNVLKQAIAEIDQREQAQTYTRPFPYATGPAYGLLFDHLKMDWKKGLDITYDFLAIYETTYLEKELDLNKDNITLAKQRNNYQEIHEQEHERKIKNEKIIAYYAAMFIESPTLIATLADEQYGRSYDMNGTIMLKDKGIVYSSIKGTDNSGNNFGNFTTLSGKEGIGISGILYSFDGRSFTFPKPTEIKENKIIGQHYEIQLNKGWKVVRLNEKGDLKIVRKKE